MEVSVAGFNFIVTVCVVESFDLFWECLFVCDKREKEYSSVRSNHRRITSFSVVCSF
jgi:hypothetical protein